MGAILGRRQFVKNALVISGSMSVAPSLAFGSLTPPDISSIYTSIPSGFPVLGLVYKEVFLKNGFSSKVFDGIMPHPDMLLTKSFLKNNTSTAILSTIGTHLSKSDPRLSLIENVPIVGPSGAKLLGWLDDGGHKYINKCSSDWGYHSIPAMVINSTDLGWVRSNVEVSYKEMTHKSRGIVEDFFEEKGAMKISGDVSYLLEGSRDTIEKTNFIQMVNYDIDRQWDSRISLFTNINLAQTRSKGALLLNLMIPNRLWERMSSASKSKVRNLCERSLYASYKLNLKRTASLRGAGCLEKICKEFNSYALEKVYKETRGISNMPLRKLFG